MVEVTFSFSIAHPFRKQIWTNPLYFIMLLFIFACDLTFVWLPYDNIFATWFILAPYELISTDGLLSQSYFNYRIYMMILIVINSASTFCFERYFVQYLEKLYLERDREKMHKDFEANMIKLKSQSYKVQITQELAPLQNS